MSLEKEIIVLEKRLDKVFGSNNLLRALYIGSLFVNREKYDVVITHEFLNRLTGKKVEPFFMADPFVQ